MADNTPETVGNNTPIVIGSTNNNNDDTPPVKDEPSFNGTHPDSFKMHSLEHNFSATEDVALDHPRWVSNEFFNSRGPTTVVRLDELTNLADKSYEGRGDTSDRSLARNILMRAGLSDHPKFFELTDRFARALNDISDPADWLWGYSGGDSKTAPKRPN